MHVDILKTEKLLEFQMFFSRKMFREWIAEIVMPWLLEELKLSLLFAILQPMILHINTLRPFLLDSTIYETLRRYIVNLD